MIEKTGDTPISERIKGFEHTPQAWKVIGSEVEKVSKDTITLLSKDQVPQDQLFETRERMQELKQVMMDNIGYQHTITEHGDHWNDHAYLAGTQVTSQMIGGLWSSLIPRVEMSFLTQGKVGDEKQHGYEVKSRETTKMSSQQAKFTERSLFEKAEAGSSRGTAVTDRREEGKSNSLLILEGLQKMGDLATERSKSAVSETYYTNSYSPDFTMNNPVDST